MILYELFDTEDHPIYQDLQISNGERQFDFLRSIVGTSVNAGADFLSTSIIKALNFHAIACLHISAGEFRPWFVEVGTGPDKYEPPAHFQVQAKIDHFVNTVNRKWAELDAISLAGFVLWQLNLIHPFVNGNGRTARAASYFVLCAKLGYWLPGTVTLPELIVRNRPEYVLALKAADAGNARVLHELLSRLLQEQLDTALQARGEGVSGGEIVDV